METFSESGVGVGWAVGSRPETGTIVGMLTCASTKKVQNRAIYRVKKNVKEVSVIFLGFQTKRAWTDEQEDEWMKCRRHDTDLVVKCKDIVE